GATTTLLYLDKFLFMAEMIINRGVTLMEMLWIVIFISPAFLAITIPISVLVASVVVFNQFSAYNE
ncbi:MAG: LptF/LptG family permease, partial [Nitrospinaceae bacterium]|nr:LptF/LptG family permease [Nitrospinaceae bacterium]